MLARRSASSDSDTFCCATPICTAAATQLRARLRHLIGNGILQRRDSGFGLRALCFRGLHIGLRQPAVENRQIGRRGNRPLVNQGGRCRGDSLIAALQAHGRIALSLCSANGIYRSLMLPAECAQLGRPVRACCNKASSGAMGALGSSPGSAAMKV